MFVLFCLTGCHSEQVAKNEPPQQRSVAQNQQSVAAPSSISQAEHKQTGEKNHLIDEDATAGVRGGDAVNVTIIVTKAGKAAEGLPLEVRAKAFKQPMTATTDDWGEVHMALPAEECTVLIHMQGRVIKQQVKFKGETQKVTIELDEPGSN
jgi:hypothetical protein